MSSEDTLPSAPVDAEWTFLSTVRELWDACGDCESWRSGLTERLMKRMVFLAGKGDPDFNQTMFEAAMINYSMRQCERQRFSRAEGKP